MNRFPLPLQVQLQHGHPGRLLAPFVYLDPQAGRIEAPDDFATDFASVRPVRNVGTVMLLIGATLLGLQLLPWLGALLAGVGLLGVLAYALVVGYGDEAATIHDWLYQCCQLPRHVADRVFYNALRSSAVARWRAWLMWGGVRLGGLMHYGKNARRVEQLQARGMARWLAWLVGLLIALWYALARRRARFLA